LDPARVRARTAPDPAKRVPIRRNQIAGWPLPILEVSKMSKEKPTDDPHQQTDWGSHKQTDKPWKGNPEKEQRPGSSKPDLEKWHETNTH
jgi:hypothetical protein